jgi:hypothetical protein
MIKTEQKTKLRINLDVLEKQDPDFAERIREQIEINPDCRE